MNTLDLVHKFLTIQRFAFIGVSRDPGSFSRTLFRDFVSRGFDPIPVNPFATNFDGSPCFTSIVQIAPVPTTALIMTSRSSAKSLVRECCQAGATLVWLYGINGPKDVPSETLRILEEHGTRVIAGYCPYMFLRDSAWFHRLHTSVWKFVGLYPK